MIDYIPCKWTGYDWVVKNCPLTSGKDKEFQRALDKIKKELPIPKWALDTTVEFDWGDGNMTGKINEIEISWRKRHFDFDENNLTIYYTIYANGHGRWVPEESIVKQVFGEIK